ncbi:ABC transporter substrate-binding protein [Blastopirellula sp. J2-11]|uniref:ABC transporter substrate-binding protein n=1 Tax=Blastopirellula sp. J2-11 TaxID=2943192 RepID=UPI0021CAC47F|nr:ABC transporter substrate-binding protein [Blastopirellula sp. J2-11]UUO08987.1 ABC transporter substrate-binding protein [Blastopirellula sp. J2-11]
MNRSAWTIRTIMFSSFCLLTSSLAAQEVRIAQPDDVPFDQIVLRDKGDTYVISIRPLVLPKGKFWDTMKETDLVRMVTDDDRTLEVKRKFVTSYVKFPQLLLNEADRLTKGGKLDAAYDYFDRMMADYPQYDGLAAALSGYLYENAKVSFRNENYSEALGFLEEAKSYRPPVDNLDTAISAAADKLLGIYIANEEFSAARDLLSRLSQKRFGELAAVTKWTTYLEAEAAKKRDEAQRLLTAGDLNAAFIAAKRMRLIYSDVSGGSQLSEEIAKRFPFIRVGITAPGVSADTTSLTFAATRDRRLLHRCLTEMIAFGADGGQYASPFGTLGRSAGGVEFSLLFRNPSEAYSCSTQLLTQPAASPRLSMLQECLKYVEFENGRELHVQLESPHVRPEALARIEIGAELPEAIPYVDKTSGDLRRLVVNPDYSLRTPTQPHAIELQSYPFSNRALSALRSGQIDIVDRLFPTLVDDAQADNSLVVDYYRMPSVHFLAPNYDNPFMQSATFRRGLLYAINRSAILNSRLLGDHEIRGCHVISAPIPAGLEADDPAGYGYDNSIDSRPYEPEMSVTLFRLALLELEQQAEADGSQAPTMLKTLKIGHPDSEVSREAVTAIAKYLKRVGLEAEIVVTPSEAIRAADVGVDLLYVEASVQESLVDIPLLFQQCVPEDKQSRYLRAALRRLNEATNWTQVRERFWTVHRLAYDETTVIPLWQLRDYFVRSSEFGGVSRQPISLFQDVERWTAISLTPKKGN